MNTRAKQVWIGLCAACSATEAAVHAHDALCSTCRGALTRVYRCEVGRVLLDADTSQVERCKTPHHAPNPNYKPRQKGGA